MIPEGDWGWNWAMMRQGKEEMEEVVFGLLFHVHIFFLSIGKTSTEPSTLNHFPFHVSFPVSFTLPYAKKIMNKQTFLLITWRIVGRRGDMENVSWFGKWWFVNEEEQEGQESGERDESFHWNRLHRWPSELSWKGSEGERGREIIRTPVQGNISSFSVLAVW